MNGKDPGRLCTSITCIVYLMVNEQIQARLCEASLTLKKGLRFSAQLIFTERHLKTTQYLLNARQVKYALRV